ncbi:hypothetical protein GY45DRAFT_1414890 [Cubamyces sp. BRFM 1775]|nr:hypothetical protein GY45DRAFT_1414890 [Cubamyces sp. BRFM 1775]
MSARVSVGADGLVVLSKLSFTTGYYSNISYDIAFKHPGLPAERHLSVCVRHPSLTDPVANQKAMANALEYLRSSEDTIHCRDVDARDFEATTTAIPDVNLADGYDPAVSESLSSTAQDIPSECINDTEKINPAELLPVVNFRVCYAGHPVESRRARAESLSGSSTNVLLVLKGASRRMVDSTQAPSIIPSPVSLEREEASEESPRRRRQI